MSAMTLSGLRVERNRLDPETRRSQHLTRPDVYLDVATAAGTIRRIPLTDADLVRLIEAAAKALAARQETS